VDRAIAQAWLDRYVAAWLSYDADDIAALFAEDIVYRYHPYDDPIVGWKAVVVWARAIRTAPRLGTRPAPTRRNTHRSPSTATSS
jgi:ketosteroid isomerase-like protein